MSWFETDRPTRAVNIDAPPAAVFEMCRKKHAEVSAIEQLSAGGTRIVLVNIDGADAIRHAFKSKLLPRNAARVPLRTRSNYI